MKCKGLHCDGCGDDWGGVAAVIALVVIVAVALRAAWPAIISAVEIAAWTVAGITGAVILAAGVLLTRRVVRWRRARRTFRGGPVITIAAQPREVARPLPPPGRPALDPPRRTGGRAWPLPGWWEEIRPRIGGDSDEHRR